MLQPPSPGSAYLSVGMRRKKILTFHSLQRTSPQILKNASGRRKHRRAVVSSFLRFSSNHVHRKYVSFVFFPYPPHSLPSCPSPSQSQKSPPPFRPLAFPLRRNPNGTTHMSRIRALPLLPINLKLHPLHTPGEILLQANLLLQKVPRLLQPFDILEYGP